MTKRNSQNEGDHRSDLPSPVPPPPNSVTFVQGQNVTVVIGRQPALKSLTEAYLLCVPLGLFGFHHFYLRRYGFGFLYLFTLGACGVGWLADLFRMPDLVKAANHRIQHPEDRGGADVSVCDAYITWFPLGIIGLHHYYLRNYHWGVAYSFTLGFFGIGWIVDSCRLPFMVRATNRRLELERANTLPHTYNLGEAYVLGVTPAGLFGAHHFYLGRTAFGVFYLVTLGGCGVGWIVDWFRMKWLVERENHPERQALGKRQKFVDDAYVLAFPFGIFGLHHFYMERTAWGVLYACTVGLFGIGWLVDLCRMPCLVSDANKRIEEELRIMAEIRQQIGIQPSAIIHREIFYPPIPAGAAYPMNPVPSGSSAPPLQPPSYEDTMATGSSLAEAATVGGAKNEGYEREKF